MNIREEMAVITAMEKALKRKKEEVREQLDGEFWRYFEDAGVEKMALNLGEVKVGEICITYASDAYIITDPETFNEFALDYGIATERKTIAPDMMDSCIKALESVFEPDVLEQAIKTEIVPTGDWEKRMNHVGDTVTYMDSNMVVPGVEYMPKRPKNTVVRGCKPEDVLPIAMQLPGGIDQLLLGGGGGE